MRIYGGPSVNISGKPKDIRGRVTLQAGLERKFKLRDVPMYAGVDLQSKQENGWDINLAVQVGIYLGNQEKGFSQQRLFVELFNGFSNMGQFYDERELYVLLGIRLNF